MIPKTTEDYARDCLRLAQFVNDSALRDRLFEMAGELIMAIEEQGPLEPKLPQHQRPLA
jgi:hypothetical protein